MINNKKITTLVLSLVFFCSLHVQAADPDENMLAQEKHCNACHSLDEPLIGPPYIAIAARHSSDKTVMVKVLARKIIRGGGGTWGVVPMVPNEHVNEEEALRLATWILSQ